MTPQRLFRAGDRVLLLEPLPGGWGGTATVVIDQCLPDLYVDYARDDTPVGENPFGYAHWSKLELIAEGTA